MTIYNSALKSSAAALCALAFSSPAFADVDAQAVLDGLEAQMTTQGMELTAESATAEGENVVLSGVSIGPVSEDDRFDVDRVLLENVTEGPNGSFLIGRVAAPSFSGTKDDIDIDFEGGAIEGYYVAGPDEQDPILKSGMFRALKIGSLDIGSSGKTIFTLDGVTAAMSPYEQGGTLDMKGEVQDFYINFENVPDPEVGKAMSDVGYTELRGRGSGEGSWDLTTGRMQGTENLVIDDAAALNIGFDFSGYTPEVVAGMQQLQAEMETKSDEAMGMAMMGLMQQLEINNISIEIEDDSATNKILDYVAQKQGTTRDGIVAMTKGMLPFVLAQLNSPDFAAKVTAAVGAYLEDPQTLKIEAAPAQPVPVAQIVAGAMTAPQALISTLGLSVTANE